MGKAIGFLSAVWLLWPAGPPAEADANLRPRPRARRTGDPTTVPIVGASRKVWVLVTWGDRQFDQAIKHLRASDQEKNPRGWEEENKKALALFRSAQTNYAAAQETTVTGKVPQSLLDRFRWATMRAALCRKRAVGWR